MIAELFSLVVGTVADLLTLALLVRFLMQWAGAPFRNPVGQFVLAVTDWAVLPVRKLVPGWFGLDWASLLLAWLVQVVYLVAALLMSGLSAAGHFALPVVAGAAGLFQVLRLMLQLASALVIIAALMSWIAPFSPLAPLFNRLTGPLLRPVQRVLPPIGGVDLSPLVVLLILQVLLRVLAYWRAGLLPGLVS